MNNNKITPPPELVGEWLCSEDYLSDASTFSSMTITSSRLQNVATRAARWGADMEVEACCQWLSLQGYDLVAAKFRAARRPKPPSLAGEALAELKEIMDELHEATGSGFTASAIHRALERLQELENND